ncbi:MAG: hypothetical protein CV087_11480 [Candidatus Brocadia sp. WS118]|nr:MAG: hypothetical protein CV087_11480 [Candidatus Brocadia sp. WS118]
MSNSSVMSRHIDAYILDFGNGFQEFKNWIKYMNYSLFLEHTHSNEYYRSKQLYINQKELSCHEKTL